MSIAKNVTVHFMNILVRYRPEGRTAREISASVEAGIRAGQLAPGDQLPPVRELAGRLGVSPTTVAAAYGDLRRRGLTTGAGRAGTRIRGAPPVSSRVYLSAPAGTRDLITGGPDPDLLPPLPAWPARRPARMYAEAPVAPRLRRLAAGQLAADGIDTASLTVTGGALDGIERVLATWLTPADRVIVEDPGHAVTFDLVAAMGFTAVPVPVDDLGIRPDALAAALARGAGAVIMTPRAQAATGAAWDAGRAAELGEVLRRHPAAGVIEDDHAGPVAGVPAFSACARTRRVPEPGSLGDRALGIQVARARPAARRAGRGRGDHDPGGRPAGARHRVGELPAAGDGRRPVVGRRGDPGARGRGADLRRAAARPCARRWRRTGSRPAAGRASPAGSAPPTRTAWRPRWPRRAGRSPRASGSASPRRPGSGSPSPAWRRRTRRRSPPTSPGPCGTGHRAWTD